MGEFVESSLESLVPVLEQLGNIQLLDNQELGSFIKRCRRYEYRLQKKEKSTEDFTLYADYLTDVLALIKSRRARINYYHKLKLIDFEIIKKIVSLLRRCCDRYLGRTDIWRKYFKFLLEHHQYKDLSKAYSRCLQYNNKDTDLYGEAALFELTLNASVENARVLLQLALRRFSDDLKLYKYFFNVEILYVERIISRRNYLATGGKKKKERGDDEEDLPEFDVTDATDAIMNLQVAEVVLCNALRNIPEDKRGEFLNEIWIILSGAKLASKESVQRLKDLVEAEVDKLSKEDIHSFLATRAHVNNENVYDVFEDAIAVCQTEEMFRRYLKYCKDRVNDPIASSRISYILGKLIENGWASMSDYSLISSNINSLIDQSDKDKVLEEAIKHYPTSAEFWSKFIEYKIEEVDDFNKENITRILDYFNEAIEKIPIDESFPVWEILIDFSVQHAPKNVEQIFERALMITSPVVASEIKLIRVKYLDALVSEGKLNESDRRTEIEKLISQKPNEPSFYITLGNMILSASIPDIELAKMAYDSAVTEHSTSSVDSWIEYIKFAYKYNVKQISGLYQRAMVTLDKEFCSDFITKWTQVSHEEAEKSVRKDSVKRVLEVEQGKTNEIKKKKAKC